MAISNAIFSHNNTISRTTKYKPIYLFNNNNISLEEEVIENTIKSQKNINKNKIVFEIYSYCIISK